MIFPSEEDYIDIHTHGSTPQKGVFTIASLMAHEGITPASVGGVAYSVGVHPWYVTKANSAVQLKFVERCASHQSVAAIGEAGIDKPKGTAPKLQIEVLEQQILIAEQVKKPLIIHCVKAWNELFAAHRKMKPQMAWIIHGFMGKKELAQRLISNGIYLSPWCQLALKPHSAQLLRSIPLNRLFLETDGSQVDIKDVYHKTAANLSISVDELKRNIAANYKKIF